jgi:hypothetical protein
MRKKGTENKTAALAVRTGPTLKAELEAAAYEANRSLSAEIEYRLLLSFSTDARATARLRPGRT